jgi:mono/diheme cytochrome c family protein
MNRRMNIWATLSTSALLVASSAVYVWAAAAPAPTETHDDRKAPGPWDVTWTIEPPDGIPIAARPAASARQRALGRSLYQAGCSGCHGEKGDGHSPLADKLNPRPTDFTRGVFKIRSTPTGKLPTDADLFRTLTRGMHGTAMQPWRRLGEAERWALVTQIESFSPRFREEPRARPIAIPLAPRELKDLRDQGEILYIRNGCGMCHGDTGEGNGPARQAFRRDPTRQVQIRDFSRGRFIRGAEMEDLFMTLRAGIDGTPMAPASNLSDDEIWALAAYVRLLVRERPLSDFPPAWHAEENGAPQDAVGGRMPEQSKR